MTFETSVEIAAGIDEVWAVLVDVERWPQWTATVTDVKLLDAGPLAVGSRVRIEQPKLPPTVWEVITLEPPHAFVWQATVRGVTTVGDHRLASEGPRRVRATAAIHQSGPLAVLAERMFGRLIRRYVEMEAEGLKRRCESRTDE